VLILLDDLPEAAFYMVGDVVEARQKGETMAAEAKGE
jgi:F0F1-type ATP synthase beta subunit